jgi:hypothetical protein
LFKDKKNEVNSEVTLRNKQPLLIDPVTVKLDLRFNVDSETQPKDVVQAKIAATQQGHKSSGGLNKNLIAVSIFFGSWILFAAFGIMKKWSVIIFMGGAFLSRV